MADKEETQKQKVDSLINSVNGLAPILTAIETKIQTMADSLTRFEAEQKTQMAQQTHVHGGDATCAGCIEYATHAMNTAENRGAAQWVKYFEEIPGVKELRQIYEDAKAAVEAGEEVLTIVG